MTQHIQELQNKYDSHTNTAILSRRFVAFALLAGFVLFLHLFVNTATTKTVNSDE